MHAFSTVLDTGAFRGIEALLPPTLLTAHGPINRLPANVTRILPPNARHTVTGGPGLVEQVSEMYKNTSRFKVFVIKVPVGSKLDEM